MVYVEDGVTVNGTAVVALPLFTATPTNPVAAPAGTLNVSWAALVEVTGASMTPPACLLMET